MKKTILIIASLAMFGCNKMEKPFVIIYKSKESQNIWRYVYQDNRGVQQPFYDINKYDIGDTIK
jgi:hypothetical protein